MAEIHGQYMYFGVANNQVLVRAIGSWSYDLIAQFLDLSRLAVLAAPGGSKSSSEYDRAAARAAISRAVVRMLEASYSHLFVDEYQDCLTDQHELVFALAATLPTAVLSDPLQSLFNFERIRLVDWEVDEVLHGFQVQVDRRGVRGGRPNFSRRAFASSTPAWTRSGT